MTASIFDQIRELDEKKSKLIEGAKAEAMKKVNDAIADLNLLGFNYRLAEGSYSASRADSRKGTRQVSDKACPICEFKTEPAHDARRHRHQPEGHKQPFTAEELTKFGLKVV